MRAEIRQRLIDLVPEVGGRVFEPHAASKETPRPFLVVQKGPEDAGEVWGAEVPVWIVWVETGHGSFRDVDALAGKVIDALHRTVLHPAGGAPYLLEYLGVSGQDTLDTDWDTIARGLRFQAFVLGWMQGLTFDPDPVAALRTWTTAQFPEVQVDPQAWMPDNAAPGVYWRLVQVAPGEVLAWGMWVDAQLRAHVVAPLPDARLTYLRRLTEALALQRALTLNDGSPLLFQQVSADSQSNPMTTGQVQVAARFGVLRTEQAAPTLERAIIGGDVQGEVS